MPALEKKKLPSKEQQQFRTVVKLYDSKMFKKATKAVDTILKKVPDHGESMAMKALILNGTNQKKEAYEFVKKAITADITSFLCWHAFGLICRSDRNYTQAIKCYQNALKHEKDNISVMKDLAYLQIQTRDIEGYAETWRALMKAKPQQKTNWICYAIGLHLQKRYATAIAVLDEFLKLETPRQKEELIYEMSEIHLYRNTIIEDSGDYQAAYNDLLKIEVNVLDKFSLKEKKASLLNRLSKFDESLKMWEELLDLNPDNHKYHKGFQTAHQLPEDVSAWQDSHYAHFEEVYSTLKNKYPRSDAVDFFSLQYFRGEKFRQVLDQYARKKIGKGVPSLFEDLKSFYDDVTKRQVFQELFTNYVQSLEKDQTFASGDEKKAAPDAVLWSKYFLAQHYDVVGDFQEAYKLIEEVLKHTPTLIEAYLTKAAILKHGGDSVRAAEAANAAREMDLADRYLNNECARYQLAADQVKEALDTVAMFTKEGEEPGSALEDMQCMWFETASGNSYLRQGLTGKALKSLLPVHKHFEDIQDDQLDFHAYCLRKMTLRAYISMLKLEDVLNSHHFYVKAARPIVKTYVELFDNPRKTKAQIEEQRVQEMPDAERKKYLQKQRNEERRRKEEEERQKELNKNKPVDDKKKTDEDPDGEQLEQAQDKLKEADKYLNVLKKYSPQTLDVQLLAFEVSMRQKKPLLALQALNKAVRLSPDHPQVHENMIKFFKQELATTEGRNALVTETIAEAKQKILGEKSLEQFNREYLNANKGNYARLVAAAKSLVLLEPSAHAEAVKLFFEFSQARGKVDRRAAESAHKWIKQNESAEAENFRAKASEKFTLCRSFLSQDQIDQLKPKLQED